MIHGLDHPTVDKPWLSELAVNKILRGINLLDDDNLKLSAK